MCVCCQDAPEAPCTCSSGPGCVPGDPLSGNTSLPGARGTGAVTGCLCVGTGPSPVHTAEVFCADERAMGTPLGRRRSAEGDSPVPSLRPCSGGSGDGRLVCSLVSLSLSLPRQFASLGCREIRREGGPERCGRPTCTHVPVATSGKRLPFPPPPP